MLDIHNILADAGNERTLSYELGRALLKSQKFRRSIEILNSALTAKGDTPAAWEIWFLISENYKQLNLHFEAFTSMINAAILANEDKESCYDKARTYITAVHAKEMLRWLENEMARHDQLHNEDVNQFSGLIRYGLKMQREPASESELESFEALVDAHDAVLQQIETHLAAAQFQEALKLVDDALIASPSQPAIIFTKIRILIEGQIDLHAAFALFEDEDIGYRKLVGEEKIRQQLTQCISRNPDNGNTHLFAGFISLLLHEPTEIVTGYAEAAKRLGIKSTHQYPDIGWHILMGELLMRNDQPDEATQHYFEAARSYYYLGMYKEALSCFDELIDKKPDFTESYYYKADILFLTSFIQEPPYALENRLREGLDIWHQSPEPAVSKKEDAWHYIIAARIHEALFSFATDRYSDEFWRAIIYAERALLHQSDDASFWMYLGRMLRLVQMETNALFALEKALEIAPADLVAQEEKLIVLLNTARFAEAKELLNKLSEDFRGELETSKSHYVLWSAFIEFYGKNRKDAIPVFSHQIAQNPADLFSRQMLMFTYFYEHQLTEARKVASELLEQSQKANYLKEAFSIAWSHFIVGETNAAIDVIESFAGEVGHAHQEYFSRLQFHLFNGNEAHAKKLFALYIEQEYNTRALHDLKNSLHAIDILYQEEFFEDKKAISIFQQTLALWDEKINERILFIQQNNPDTQTELNIKRESYLVEKGSLADIAMTAVYARIERDEGNMSRAFSLYEELTRYPDLFPEAAMIIDKFGAEQLEQALSFINDGNYDDAAQKLHALELRADEDIVRQNAMLAITAFGLKDVDSCHKFLSQAFEAAAGDISLQNLIWKTLQTHAAAVAWTMSFGKWLLHNSFSFTDDVKEGKMQYIISHWLNPMFNAQNKNTPYVTPIAIELHTDLLPPEAYNADWYVITEKIPQLRQRVREATGQTVPYIRIRANDTGLDTDYYVIYVKDNPISQYRVYTGRVFVTDQSFDAASHSIETVPGWNPLTSQMSVWVDQKNTATLMAQKIAYWDDPYDYVLTHLERIIMNMGHVFVDSAFTSQYLTLASSSPENEREEMIRSEAEQIQHNEDMFASFLHLLKGLLFESVPITDKATIIGTFFRYWTPEYEQNDMLALLRLALKHQLPFNLKETIIHRLKPETEILLAQAMITSEGKTFLALKPEHCQDVLTEIRSMVTHPDFVSAMIVVQESRLRYPVKLLVLSEFPSLYVASQNELNTL